MPVSASKAIRRASSTAHPLPPVPALAALGVAFRAGQLVMVTGRPAAGKSNFAQWLAHEWALPTLYFALDMTPFTAATREAAIITGHRVSDVARHIDGDGPEAAFYEEELESSVTQFCFDKAPGDEDVVEELDAYVELWGEYPRVMVFDNLLNFAGAEEDHRVQKFILRELQSLAYRTGALVIVLHHAREGVKDVTRPPTAAETDNKVNQIPEVILSVAKDPGSDRFAIAKLKVRDGASDPNAERAAVVWADFSKMHFSPSPPAPPAWSPGGWDDGEDD